MLVSVLVKVGAVWLTVGLLLMAAAYLGDLARGMAADAYYLRKNWKGVVVLIVVWPLAVWMLHQEFARTQRDGER